MQHTTSIRNMAANEGGRGNLAGVEVACTCGFRFGTTMTCDGPTIAAQHVAFMTKHEKGGKR